MATGFGLSPFGTAPFGDPVNLLAGPRGGLWLGGYLGPTTIIGPPVPLGQPGETASATPVRRVKARRAGQAVEAALARPVTRRKLRGTGQAADVEVATQVRPLKRRRIGPGRDKQRARPIRRLPVLEPVVELDTARPVQPG